MRPPAPPRKALALAALETALSAADLRLRSGDKRRQPVDVAAVRNGWLRLGLRLSLRLKLLAAVFAMAAVIALLVLVALLIGLSVALVVAWIVIAVVARHERLGLHGNEAGFLAEM